MSTVQASVDELTIRIVSAVNGTSLAEFNLGFDDAVAKVKAKVAERAAVPTTEQRLLLGSDVLEDYRRLRECLPLGQPVGAETVLELSLLRSRDKRQAICGGDDGALRLLDIDSGAAQTQVQRGHSSIMCCIDADWAAQMAVSGSKDGTINLWDLRRFRLWTAYGLKGHRGEVNTVALHSKTEEALSGGADGIVLRWNIQKGVVAGRYRAHQGGVRNLKANAVLRLVYSVGADCTLRLFDWEQDAFVCEIEDLAHAPRCLAVDWTLQRVLVGGTSGELKLWSSEDASCVRTLSCAERPCFQNNVMCLAVDWASQRAVSGSRDKALRLWDIQTGDLLREVTNPARLLCVVVDWSSLCAICGGEGGFLRLWDLQRGEFEELDRVPGAVWCVAADWISFS